MPDVRFLPGDNAALRKQRGAFFTPYAIAEFLADWVLAGAGEAPTVLDPTSGEGVFLFAAAEHLRRKGLADDAVARGLHGVDIHEGSLQQTSALLAGGGYVAQLTNSDFFPLDSPAQLGGELPWMDAEIGNPPFVRFHEHRGEPRRLAASRALENGVRLNGLASSWAPLLVHACSFLKPEGRGLCLRSFSRSATRSRSAAGYASASLPCSPDSCATPPTPA